MNIQKLEEDRKYVQFWSSIGEDEDGIICKLLVDHFRRNGMLNEKCCVPIINVNVILKYKDMFGYQLENGELQSVAEFVHDNMVK